MEDETQSLTAGQLFLRSGLLTCAAANRATEDRRQEPTELRNPQWLLNERRKMELTRTWGHQTVRKSGATSDELRPRRRGV
jgi:hypothetical protein